MFTPRMVPATADLHFSLGVFRERVKQNSCRTHRYGNFPLLSMKEIPSVSPRQAFRMCKNKAYKFIQSVCLEPNLMSSGCRCCWWM